MSNDHAKKAGNFKFYGKDARYLHTCTPRWKADGVAYFRTCEDGAYLHRADCEALRDWLTARLEETNPRIDEVWRVGDAEYIVESEDNGWVRNRENGRLEDVSVLTGGRRIGKIVYD